MNVGASFDAIRFISGSIWERSDRAAAELGPLLPECEDMQSEFRAHLRRSVDGVEFAYASMAQNAVLETRPGFQEVFQRGKLFGRVDFEHEAVIGGDIDHVRGSALALARMFAEHVGSQAASMRADRGELAAVVIRQHDTLPRLLCRYGDQEPLICYDHCTLSIVAIYRAYYFVTPPGVEPQDHA